MKKPLNIKKLVLLNLPYLLMSVPSHLTVELQ